MSIDETDKRTDGRTAERCIDPTPHAMRAASRTNHRERDMISVVWSTFELRGFNHIFATEEVTVFEFSKTA